MLNHKKATIKDVALAAGVSTQTVSRVLNNRLDVSVGTRQRILEIIAGLHYSPSTFARRMRRENDGDELIADALNFAQAWVSFGVLAEQASVGEIRSAIESALANGALSQEKAVWLLEGLEKGFITDGRFLQK